MRLGKGSGMFSLAEWNVVQMLILILSTDPSRHCDLHLLAQEQVLYALGLQVSMRQGS